MLARNSYIIIKSLNHYLRGSVFIAVSDHLVSTTDAVVVSWLLGHEALSAVNIVLPVVTFISALIILLGEGGADSVSSALGEGNIKKMGVSFSSSMIVGGILGIILAVLVYHFCTPIVDLLISDDLVEKHYTFRYLQTFCFAIPLMLTAGILTHILRSDGGTKIVGIAVACGLLAKIIFDIVFVGYTSLGITGAAWASAINYLLIFGICLFHFHSKNNNIKWSWDWTKYLKQIFKNLKKGFFGSINTILIAVTLYVINSIMIKSLGSEGIYCWAVSFQIFIILGVLLDGIDSGIKNLGEALVVQNDVTGLYYIFQRCSIYLLISVVGLSLLIIIFPEFFGTLFGNTGDDRLHLLPGVLRIFSLSLFPYALMAHVKTIYDVIHRKVLGFCLTILPYGLMILFVYLLSDKQIIRWPDKPEYLIWWAFPASSWMLVGLLLLVTWIFHEKNKDLRFLTVLPKTEPGSAINISVSLTQNDVNEVAEKVGEFLDKEKVDNVEKTFVSVICRKAVEGILNNFREEDKRDRYFDLHIWKIDDRINMVFKDDGKRISIPQEDDILNDLKPEEDENDSESSTDHPTIKKTSGTSYAPYKSFAHFLYLNGQNVLIVDVTREDSI